VTTYPRMESPPSGFRSRVKRDGVNAKTYAVTEVMVSARNIQLKTFRMNALLRDTEPAEDGCCEKG